MLRETLRTSSRWSRRSALGGVGAAAVALGLGLSSRDAHVAAQDATPAAMAGHPLIGTWIVDRNPADPSEMPTTNVFTADGGLIDPSVGAAGVWAATGPDTADFTLIAIFAEGRPAIGVEVGGGSYFLVRGSVVVDAGGDTATTTVSQTHVAPDGTVLDQVAEGTSTYLRLHVEPQGAVGNPLAGFPAWTPQAAATPTS
jgi:hypothetical protein